MGVLPSNSVVGESEDVSDLAQDEATEVAEFLQEADEIDSIQILEIAEFVTERDEQDETLTDSVAQEGQPAPGARARGGYWQAQGLVELQQSLFTAALEAGNTGAQHSAYYRLAVYHGRTISILRSALNNSKEGLVQAAMRNLVTLHRAMMQMHRQSPHVVPVALVLDRQGRDLFARDLVVRALSESSEQLELEAIVTRVNELDVMGIRPGTVERHLKDLTASGYVEHASQRPSRYIRSGRVYPEMSLSAPALRTLVGEESYADFKQAGYADLSHIAGRRSAFLEKFTASTDLGETSGSLLVEIGDMLLEDRTRGTGPWNYTDLIGSSYPRPYQYEAYAVFRGYGYDGQLVEAPTGSGKTMIGMMCIQDWLCDLRAGQSILVLVPTSNYQQQWTGEVCYKEIGLRLSPEMVFSGTPRQLERFQKRTGSHPAVLIMTYTALAQAGSGIGKGGFDIDSIEMFLQDTNVQYVILDEVHKVADDLSSVSADVTRLLLEWLHDGSLQGLIGFTGTAEAYRRRFVKLGLQLVYNIPIDELIAAGFVAPFAELGAPFSYSARERRIRGLLDQYKLLVSAFMEMLGADRLRAWFAELPMEKRTLIGHEILGIYHGRKEWETDLGKRFQAWESGGKLKLTEVKLVDILQIAHAWTDAQLVQMADADAAKFEQLLADINGIRTELLNLIYLPSTLSRLQKPGFATTLDVEAMLQARKEATNHAARSDATRDALCTTIVGLYDSLTEWYRRVGEGRVEIIKAIIEAERATRSVSGIIIFDNACRIDWKHGLATPGYQGLGGLYAQLLGDDRFTPYAVLSSEQYLPYNEQNPLPPRIATFIERELMQGEIAQAMFDLIAQGLGLSEEVYAGLQQRWNARIADYIPRLGNVHAPRPGEFSRRVLRSIRTYVRKLELGSAGERLLARMDLRNVHFADLVRTFFDYAIITRYFRRAKVAELEQVSGARQKFFVIPMPSGRRKLLMYDLTSRLVDAESLPINLIVVSNWARTGWNVISPNLLIDATATRDVTAWQQLRGRAIRARRTWTNDCYRLIMVLIGSQMQGLVGEDEMPEDVATIVQHTHSHDRDSVLDEHLRSLLYEITPSALKSRIKRDGLAALSEDERTEMAIELMRRFNKVTHIYEMIKAYGSTSQVTLNRQQRVWQRKPSVALKHAREVSVNPFTGVKSMDSSHAPLVYVDDPRADVPSEFQQHLAKAIADKDGIIVSGWFGEAATSDT